MVLADARGSRRRGPWRYGRERVEALDNPEWFAYSQGTAVCDSNRREDAVVTRTSLRIHLLGPLEVRRDCEVLALPRSRKTRALLAYLVATARPHGRGHLCDLLWEGPADPRAALRWALSKIRPLVNDAAATRLISERGRVRFEPHGAAVDVSEIQGAVRPSLERAPFDALRGAAAGFRGDFLEGLEVAGCYRFDAWLTGERSAARALRIRILAALVERLTDDAEAALGYARDRLQLEPATEAAHRDVIETLARLERTDEALEQYERCRKILKREMGTRPSPELERLRGALANRRGPAAAAAAPEAPAPSGRTGAGGTTGFHRSAAIFTGDGAIAACPPPLVGRAAERETLRALVAAARRREPTDVLLLAGEPGIGKTRLLEELAWQVREFGGDVLAGRGFEVEMVRPYGAWIDALRAIPVSGIPEPLRPEIAPLVPELPALGRDPSDPTPPPGRDERAASEGERARLFEAVAAVVADRAARRAPLVLVVDDLHWLDEGSIALLHFVARRLDGTGVLIACSTREAELTDNPAAQRFVRELRRAGRLREERLGPLGAADVAELIRVIAPAADPERVFAESDGNALFAIEIARAGRTGDALPPTLGELLDDRIADLDAEARAVLPWAAALGHRIRPELVARAAELSGRDLLRALEDLEVRGILRAGADGYDFTHELLLRAAYARVTPPRRKLLHARIARALETVHGADGARAGAVAHHAALGGDDALAARAYLGAARQAVCSYAYPDAARLADRGLEHARRLPRRDAIALRVDLLGIGAHRGMEDFRGDDFEGELIRAVTRAQELGLAGVAKRGFDTLAHVHFLRGEFRSALAGSLRAEEVGRAADPATVVRAIASTARCLGMLERDMARAAALIREAESLSAHLTEEVTELWEAHGHLHHHAGELEKAAADFDRAVRAARRDRDHWRECYLLTRLAMIATEAGDAVTARERCAEIAPVAMKLGDGGEAPFAEAIDALAARRLGEPDATDRLEGALQRLREVDSRWMIAWTQSHAAEQELQGGELDSAQRRARDALECATLVDRLSEAAVARALLARMRAQRGGPRPIAIDENGLSARARSALRAARTQQAEIPT